MFRALWLVVCVVTLGCTQGGDEETDEVPALLRESLPGINQECIDAVAEGGVDAMPQDVRRCFVMTDQKHWAGLWLDGFEGSRFCAEPAKRCTFDTEGQRVWLSFAEEVESERPGRYSTGKLYEIEFIGRQTSEAGAFGHMGGSDREIVVEKLIRLERVSES